MIRRLLASLSGLTMLVALLAATPSPVAGQARTPGGNAAAASKKWTPPRTPWGDPDLQGIWNNGTVTPLQRPKEFAGRETLTEEERAALDQDALTRYDRPPRPGDPGFYNQIWWDPGPATNRTSLIVDPADGLVPPLTPEAQQRRAARAAALKGRGPADSWEDRPLWERCIIYRPLPRIPTNYNNNYEFVQAPGYVGILQEEIHEVRVIPLDRRPHVGRNIRQYLGDSRGHWEGDTLVVETTNFTDKTDFQGSGTNLRLIERFTRVAPDVLEYQFTVSDPMTWTRPWTAGWPWMKTDGPIFEYSCHEGNLGMENILSGARAEEKAAAAKKSN
jgi:hypothetical protein